MKILKQNLVFIGIVIYVVFSSTLLANTKLDVSAQTFSIHVSSFKNQTGADKEKRRLSSENSNVYIFHEKVKGRGMWYRVYLGRYDDRKKAVRAAKKFKTQGLINYTAVKKITITKEVPIVVKQAPKKMSARQLLQQKNISTAPLKPAKPAKSNLSNPRLSINESPKKAISHNLATDPDNNVINSVKKEPINKPVDAQVVGNVNDKPNSVAAVNPETISAAAAKSPQKKSGYSVPGYSYPISRYSLGVKVGIYFASNANKFAVTKTANGNTQVWQFKRIETTNSFSLAYRHNHKVSWLARYDQALLADVDLSQFSFGAGFNLNSLSYVSSYVRGGVLFSKIKWDAMPGKFGMGTGAEVGLGIVSRFQQFIIGFEALYTSLSYDYEKSGDTSVTATSSKLNYSGVAISVVLRFPFE